jgi:ribosomal protein L11 methyltransferase
VTISQAYLEPISAGRFHVYTGAHADSVPAGVVAFRIEAGRAFGTGHHETTTGCLMMLDRFGSAGQSFANIADIGTGTGLLAFAAHALWPDARIIASDIDPISIDVTRANMAENHIPADAIALAAADGMEAPALVAAAPYDLIIANILAGPLIDLAPSFAHAAAPGATILLAGLLASQADDVLAAFAEHGFVESQRVLRGEWPTLAIVQQA